MPKQTKRKPAAKSAKKKKPPRFSLGKFLYYGFLIFLGFLLAVTYKALLKPAADNPESFVAGNHHRPGRKVVVCAGDNLTRGQLSFDYCSYLNQQAALQNYQFVNAGLNGDLSYNLLQRLEPIAACQPNDIVILIGTNDLTSSLYPKTAPYLQWIKHVPHSASLAWYSENLELIIQILQQRTRARIALLSLPVLGEAATSAANQTVGEYNQAIRSIAARKNVRYLPLYETQLAYLQKNQIAPGPKYQGEMQPMLWAALNHQIFKQSWDLIGERNGYLLLTDGVHLDSRSGRMIAGLVEAFVKSK